MLWETALMSPTVVGVQMFGPLLLRLPGGGTLSHADFVRTKPKQVLEILLAGQGHPVPKDRIAEYLWGEAPPENAMSALETYVSLLRRALDAASPGARRLVVTERGAYRFAIEEAEVDLFRFDALLERAAGADSEVARALLEEALELVRGEPLEDEPYAEWAERLRRRYRWKVTEARLDAAEAALVARDMSAALSHAEVVAESDSLNERATRAAMLAAYSLGRRDLAAELYRRCCDALREQLDIEPLPETQAIYAAVGEQQPLDPLLPPDVHRAQPGFRRLVENMAASMWWTTDSAGNVTAVSGAGWMAPNEDDLGALLGIDHVMPAIVARALGGERVSEQIDTGSRVLNVHVEPIGSRQGAALGTVGVALDVTERVRAERALREAEERFRRVFEPSSDPILIIDPYGDRFLDVNTTAHTLLGYTREELMSKRPSDLHAQEIPQLLAFVQATTTQGWGWTDRLTCTTKTGELVPLQLAAAPVTYSGCEALIILVKPLGDGRATDPALHARLGVTTGAGGIDYSSPK